MTPPPWNVRTRVHEYGGGAVRGRRRARVLLAISPTSACTCIEGGEAPRAITPPGPWRFADGVIDRRAPNARVRGRGPRCSGGARSTVSCALTSTASRRRSWSPSGHDFYAAPRLEPGRRPRWRGWRGAIPTCRGTAPSSGWRGWTTRVTCVAPHRVAGGRDESIVEPSWTPDGRLHFVSDRTGWWNLYRVEPDGALCALRPIDAEFARPPWVFGQSHHAVARRRLDAWSPGTRDGALAPRALDRAGAAGATDRRRRTRRSRSCARRPAVPSSWAPRRRRCPPSCASKLRTGELHRAAAGAASAIDPSLVSAPEAFACPSAGGRVAHGLHYPPVEARARCRPPGAPPLIVRCHGGPTAAAPATLDPVVQFWTSRGFALLDVNYAGSSGYGRAYRRLLDGAWGVADVEDCVAAARYAVAQGWGDPARLVVRGSSAGGFTVLCALAFHDVFAAGASYYGIGDLEALRRDTHKFESYYDQSLIGPYPERRDLYVARSPLHAADRIRRPVIFFQGLEDRVVPPGQSEAMAAALRARGVRVDLVTFPGEGHGFRRAESIVRALEAEHAFYREVLGLGVEILETRRRVVV